MRLYAIAYYPHITDLAKGLSTGAQELLLKYCLGTIHIRRWQIWPIFDPYPLKNADVLNGWSLSSFFVESRFFLPFQ